MTTDQPGQELKERRKATWMLILTAMLWSTSGILIKSIPWDPLAIAGGRSLIAALTIILLTRRLPRFTWSLNQLCGAVCYATTVTTFVIATKMTTAANAILLQYTAPVYTVLFGGRLLNEKASRFDLAAVAAVMGGLVLFLGDGLSPGYLIGNLLAAVSGASFGFFIIFMRRQKNSSPVETVILGNLFAALFCAPLLKEPFTETAGWGWLVLLGACQLGLPYYLYSLAIKQVKALESVLISMLEPLLNPVWVFLLIGEKPGRWSVLGGIVVLAAVTVHGLINTRQEKAKSEKSYNAF